MAILKISNAASSLLAADIGSGATTLAISSGDEGRFPSLVAGEWFPLTVADGAGNREHMRCTARAGVTLTVTRAQEGSTALAWTAGARVDLRMTAGAFHEHTGDASRLSTGTVPNAVLPARMKETAAAASDIDAVAASGWYTVDSAVAGLPIAEDGYLWHVSIDADTAIQEFQPINAMDRYGRRQEAGTWGSWYVSVIPGSKLESLAAPGVINFYAGATPPSGWLLCYGQAVSRTTYAALWTAIGSAWGAGDGSTTFNLPDFRGRAPFGKDNMGGTAANRLTTAGSGVNGAALGADGGAETVTLTTAQIPAHAHSLTGGAADEAGAHVHEIDFDGETSHNTDGGGRVASGGNSNEIINPFDTQSSGAHSHALSGDTQETGGGEAHANIPPAAVVNVIIKY